jgi:hypothetical protein
VVLLGSISVHDELVEVREEQARLLASNLLPRDLAPLSSLQLPPGDLADWRRGLRAGPAVSSRTVGARYSTASVFYYRTYHVSDVTV